MQYRVYAHYHHSTAVEDFATEERALNEFDALVHTADKITSKVLLAAVLYGPEGFINSWQQP